jgi:hypothetical protein
MTPRKHLAAVGRDGESVDIVRVTDKLAQLLPSGYIPESCRPVESGCEELAAIGRECHFEHAPRMRETASLRSSRHIEQPRPVISGEHILPVWRKNGPGPTISLAMPLENPEFFAS